MGPIKRLRDISDEYLVGRELGKGTYGTVHICSRQSKPRDANLVIKKIDLKNNKRKGIADLVKEAKLLKLFDHPNIVKLADFFATPDTLCIVQEFCNYRDMAYEVKQMKTVEKRLFKEEVIWNWFLQLCCAVKHIHDRKVLHRDIKTANIFLHLPDKASMPVVRLGDFGISKALEQTAALAKSTVGTPYYMSPELCESKPYSFKSDVWAIGIVLYELTTLRQPFDSHNFNGLVLKILRGKFESPPASYSQDLHRMIKILLVGDTDRRPDLNEVLQMEVCTSKLFKSNIAIDVLQREFAHTALHGFRPCQILEENDEVKTGQADDMQPGFERRMSTHMVCWQHPKQFAVHFGENMSKLYGALDDVRDDPELQVPTNSLESFDSTDSDDAWERHRQNLDDLQNGTGNKFLLNGKTLDLPGTTSTSSRHERIEALRAYLEKQLGAGTFMQVYNIMSAVSEGDDEDVLSKQLQDFVGERNNCYLCLVAQLIFCEDLVNQAQNASS